MNIALDFPLLEALRVIREGREDCVCALEFLVKAANDDGEETPKDDAETA